MKPFGIKARSIYTAVMQKHLKTKSTSARIGLAIVLSSCSCLVSKEISPVEVQAESIPFTNTYRIKPSQDPVDIDLHTADMSINHRRDIESLTIVNTGSIISSLAERADDLEIAAAPVGSPEPCVTRFSIAYEAGKVIVSVLVAGTVEALDDLNDIAGTGYVHDSDPSHIEGYESTFEVPDNLAGHTDAADQITFNTKIACTVFNEVFGT